eukprot:gene15871-17470_t
MDGLGFFILSICAFGIAANVEAATCGDVQRQSSCASLKNAGFCTDDRHKDWMKRNCQLTCGHCVLACRDVQKQFFCDNWKSQGFCTNDRYKNYMKRNCRVTCGYCGGATTRPQPVTTNPQPATTAALVSGDCGHPEVQQSRVLAGINATKGSWPWQILMLFNGRTMCGGSIVAPNWIVTAAHCVSGREGQASSFKVR